MRQRIQVVKTAVVLAAMLVLTGCFDFEFMFGRVPVVEAGKGVHPLPKGLYRGLTGSKGKWELRQTGIEFTEVADRYQGFYHDDARTFVAAGKAFEDSGFRFGLFFLTPKKALPIDYSEPQSRLIFAHHGFVLGALEPGYFAFQWPGTFDPGIWPGSRKDGPIWFIQIAKWDGAALEIGFCKPCEKASRSMFGTVQNCPPGGTCTEVPRVKDFTESAEMNRALLQRAVRDSAYELRPDVRLELVK